MLARTRFSDARRAIKAPVAALVSATTLLAGSAGCLSANYKITGQTDLYKTDLHGDVTAAPPVTSTPVAITKGTTFSIRLDSVFVRHVKEIGGSEFLVYAEIFDVQPDDRQRLVKVLFKENNQAPGFLINQRDRVMLGPMTYNGHPIRIRLFVVELDGGENKILSEVLKQAVRIASAAQPGMAALSSSVSTAGDLFLSLDQDDRELMFDFTLFPRSHNQGPYLETGHIVLIKTENASRVPSEKKSSASGATVSASRAGGKPAGVVYPDIDVVIDEYGRRIDGRPEDYATLFSYSDDEHEQAQGRAHPLGRIDIKEGNARGTLQPYLALRVMDSQLWLQAVALEWCRSQTAGQKAPQQAAQQPPCHLVMADERLGMTITMPTAAQAGTAAGGTASAGGTAPGAANAPASPAPQLPALFSIRSYKIGGVDQKELVVNDGTETFRLGKRVQYREKTHAVVTIASGGEPHNRSMFEELSAADQQTLDKVLQPELTPERIREQIADLATPLIKARLTRDVVRTVNTQAASDPGFRLTPGFPLAYLKQLDSQPTPDEALKNASIIDTVANMVLGFPYTDADASNQQKLGEMLSLTADRFTPTGSGLFRFTTAE